MVLKNHTQSDAEVRLKYWQGRKRDIYCIVCGTYRRMPSTNVGMIDGANKKSIEMCLCVFCNTLFQAEYSVCKIQFDERRNPKQLTER